MLSPQSWHFQTKSVPKFDRKKNDPFSSDQRREIWNRVGDPDPQDPHVFGPPGSGSISQRYGSGSGSGTFPFLIKVLSGLK
jgi:hypothetical protein